MPYRNYTIFMRDLLQLVRGQGLTVKEISLEFAVHHSTVYRELRRNSVGEQYISDRAHARAAELRYQSKPCPKQ